MGGTNTVSDFMMRMGNRALGSVLAILGLTLLPSCAKRIDFTPEELERVQTKAGVDPLRVYVSQKVIAQYTSRVKDESFNVNRDIREASRQDRRKVETTRNTMGLILEVAELNGQPLLWVTFSPRCKLPECAYGFVQTEDKKYRLVSIPELPTYGKPTAYRGMTCESRKLSRGKLASLAEANEVYVLKRSNGKLQTIDLQVKKLVERGGRTTRERNVGIE